MQQLKMEVKLMTLLALWNLLMTVVDLLITSSLDPINDMRVVDLLMALVTLWKPLITGGVHQ